MLCVVAGIIAAFAVSTLLHPRFTTYTDLMINPAQPQLASEDLYNKNAQREAQLLTVESKIRMLTSTNVLSRVIDKLSLQQDPEFVGEGGDTTPQEKRLSALRALYDRVSIRRDGQSFVATLAVWSRAPLTSIATSDAMVDAFKVEVAAADADTSLKAASAIDERLDSLRKSANEASAKVASFRSEHQLESSGGELLSSQSLSQLNAQLNLANERLMRAKARYAATRALQAGEPARDDIAASPVLTSLRTRLALVEEELQSQSVVLGPRYPKVSMLELGVASVKRAIDAEIARMMEIARSEVEQAQTVVAELQGQLNGTRGAASQDSEALVKLGELQHEADVQTALYKNYLQRKAEFIESSQVDVTDIRVISYPVPPKSRSWPPRTLYLLAAGAVAGAIIGALWVLLGRLTGIYGPDIRRRLVPG